MISVLDTDRVALLRGDCLEVLRAFADNSVDAVVTDPPYGLSSQPDMIEVLKHWLAGDDYVHKGGGFMGKTWDSFVPGPSVWREVFRVLKPGGHLLSYFGSRTYDLGVLAIRLGGFEIRDMLEWLYGTGFPKSLNVGKAITERAGGHYESGDPEMGQELAIEAAQWEGWGTALKPAHEPIVLARKPLTGTVAANVLAHGTGALNIDGCRIATDEDLNGGAYSDQTTKGKSGSLAGGLLGSTGKTYVAPTGRWPANVCLDEEAAALLDEQSGESKSATGNVKAKRGEDAAWKERGGSYIAGREVEWEGYGDKGGASRFFKVVERDPVAVPNSRMPERSALDGLDGLRGVLPEDAVRFRYVAKASRSERDQGCEHLPPKTGGEATDREDGSIGTENPRAGAGRTGGARNFHPTVKPIALMRWLVRLVTPPGGTVLDPFTGSGTTGIAALQEGFNFLGIERDESYCGIAAARLGAADLLKGAA